MANLTLTGAKNRRTGFLLRFRRKVTTLKAICNDPENQGQDRLPRATARLAETWQEYENSQQDFLGLVTEDKVENKKVTFLEMEDNYEAAIDEAKKITKRELKVEEGSGSQLDRAVRLTLRRMALHEQVTTTLELERSEIAQLQESLRAQHGLLKETELRIQEAKELTQELLEHHIFDFEEGIVVSEHWQRITDLEDASPSLQFA